MRTDIDLLDREGSWPVLIDYLNRQEEPPINLRTTVLMERCLQGWRGLFEKQPVPHLTVEGAFMLYLRWKEDDETG